MTSFKYIFATCIFLAVISLHSQFAAAQSVQLYRYTDENGNPVIRSSIPPKEAQKGYEIINAAGEVIKTVAPAPSKDEISRVSREREILNTYQMLKRRFSTIDDIEKAKQRKLESINTNIAILKGNISNLDNEIDALVAEAADQERAGRKVSNKIIDKLSDTRLELSISKKLLKNREAEYFDITKKYDQDIQDFIKGESLEVQNIE